MFYLDYMISYKINQWKTEFEYSVPNKNAENKKEENKNTIQKATIYRATPRSNKVILFVSGAFCLELHIYISKIMNDILLHYPDIASQYELICFEKKDTSSIVMYDDVAYFIETIHKEIQLEELILIGFSSGGVISSHILSRLNHISCKKLLITYDTPWQIRDNVKSFSFNRYYRIDFIFYLYVYLTYQRHYNYEEIKKWVNYDKWTNGYEELVSMIQHIHQFDDETFDLLTGFNYNLSEDVKVVNIYHEYDPLVVRKSHDVFYEKNKSRIVFQNHFICKKKIGHCSDMWNSIEYLEDIVQTICEFSQNRIDKE